MVKLHIGKKNEIAYPNPQYEYDDRLLCFCGMSFGKLEWSMNQSSPPPNRKHGPPLIPPLCPLFLFFFPFFAGQFNQ